MDQNNVFNLSQATTENQTIDAETDQGSLRLTVLLMRLWGGIYTYLLRQLPLTSIHRDNLHKRGLTDEEILRREYGTLPMWGRKEIAKKAVDHFGEDICAQVPGFFKVATPLSPVETIAALPA